MPIVKKILDEFNQEKNNNSYSLIEKMEKVTF
jgi:hypothetical protein